MLDESIKACTRLIPIDVVRQEHCICLYFVIECVCAYTCLVFHWQVSTDRRGLVSLCKGQHQLLGFLLEQ